MIHIGTRAPSAFYRSRTDSVFFINVGRVRAQRVLGQFFGLVHLPDTNRSRQLAGGDLSIFLVSRRGSR